MSLFPSPCGHLSWLALIMQVLCAIMISGNSYVHLSCFFQVHPPSLALRISLSPLLHRSLSLDGRGLMKTSFKTECSKISCFLHIVQLWVSVLIISTAEGSVSAEG